ncbi:MAG: hypothetical protein IJA10_10845 [Lachnospiraceae bacterium]|nr:hypothetical protein [Lachnospiraceae bacterium]
MFIYYDDDFENKEEIIKKYKAKVISHYVCSMEKIDGVEPAYESIKELLPYIYEGSYLVLSKDNKLQLTYDETMQFVDKVMETTSEEDIFYSEEPWYVIQNIIRDCTTMAIDKRLNDIKRDFMNVEIGLNHLKVHW